MAGLSCSTRLAKSRPGCRPSCLRVLQEREFERVGGNKTIQVDVRVLATTNRNLQRSVENGDFREDLYYRLNVFPLKVPPLRERTGDVLLLAQRFLERLSRRYGTKMQGISPPRQRRRWPGIPVAGQRAGVAESYRKGGHSGRRSSGECWKRSGLPTGAIGGEGKP